MMGALYPTKKALKAAVGQPLRYEETSMYGEEYKRDGRLTVVGPSPRVRNWFAVVVMVDGKISKVM